MSEHIVTLITIPLCPKCKIMRKRLQKLRESHPEITIEEKGLQSYLDKAIRNRIMDAPILLIKDQMFAGIVDEKKIIEELEL